MKKRKKKEDVFCRFAMIFLIFLSFLGYFY